MAVNTKLALAMGAWAFGIASMACALPVVDTKDAAVSISTPDARTMNITSKAPNNVIRWVDFSIAGGKQRETVSFDNRNYLNYVKGNAPSEIFGTLKGGGNIYIVNPKGILIGDGATVNVGNLYLSTQVLSDAQLAAFSAQGKAPILDVASAVGDVINLGHLKAMKIVVEGNVIKFKNVEDVESPTIETSAKTETRVGYVAGSVDPADYKSFETASWYTLIRTQAELQAVKLNDATSRYMLANNIRTNGTFTAIGTHSEPEKKFLGHFDGLGYGIKLKGVNANGKASGLFGAIGAGSIVENVSVHSVQIPTMNVGASDLAYIGGVVGYSERGTVRNVRYGGDIKAENSCKVQYVGGIVGYNYGGVVENACNTGKVSASGSTNTYVGGIVGYNRSFELYNIDTKKNDYFEADIKSSCNLGELESNVYVGGVVGDNDSGRLENVYNVGELTGKRAGGIIGKNRGKPREKETVSWAYHAGGKINGSYQRGGIVADDDTNKGVFSHVFYETVTTDAATDSFPGAARNGAQLKSVNTFLNDGWNISSVSGAGATWRIYDGQSMPLLTAFLKPKDNISVVEFDGTKAAGTYWSTPSTLVSPQLIAYQKGEKTFHKYGYDYVSDVTCVLPKQEAAGTKPSDLTKPSETARLSDSATMATKYSISREYKNEMVALQHLEKDVQREAAEESETEKLIIVGTGVRLPDDVMSVAEVGEMFSEAEAREKA